ncbi:acyl-CoA synthetase [Actinoplanes sp. CA-015351]|uniref:acyl-CoA synthetase n=1 Tax=Actinoplanes sp. CA-015351 TaxID=3239897 RepID=UPI003D95A704
MNGIGMWTVARESPQREAIVEPGGRTLTYGDLAAEADRIGRGLRAAGLGADDTIALLMPNGADILIMYFAAVQIGLHVVPLNWHLTAPELAYILRDSGAKAFVADARFADAALAAADEADLPPTSRFAVGDIPGFLPSLALGAGGSGRPEPRTLGALMVYTSGTSGRPKGVRRPLLGLDPDDVPPVSLWFFGLFGLRPFDDHVHLCCSPLYHTAVMNFAVISVQMGHQVVVMDHWDSVDFLHLVDRHRVTHSHMVPTQFRRLLTVSDRGRFDISSMRAMIHGAAPCPQPVKQAMLDWWGPVVIEYYAASEGGGTLITAQEWLARPGSVGQAWPGSRVRVLDDDGKDAPELSPGRVYLQMGDATFEYHGDAEKTRASWRDRMFTVGDIGYLDADGYLFLCDRASDVIITGGVNVYPAEIENELSGHPSVADVAVFGIPHEEWGEEIKAVVEPADGVVAGPELTASLLDFLTTRLARFKIPRTVDYVERLPRDPNGKLYKRLLRDPYWSGRDRAI